MVDIHCHILPGIDDGAYNIDISLKMAQIAKNDGIKTIVATPHYIEYENELSKDFIKSKCDLINDSFKNNHIDIKVLPGCEAYISNTLPSKYKCGSVLSINDNGKYILIELPMAELPAYVENVIFEFKLMGVTPIIAHIERYRYIKNNFELVYNFIKKGALIQVNSTSITGLFGNKFAKCAIKLVKANMVHLIASDAHTASRRSPRITESLSILEDNGISDEIIDYITENGYKVVNGQDINVLKIFKNHMNL